MSHTLVTLFTLLSGQQVSSLYKFQRCLMQVLPDHFSHISNLALPPPTQPGIFHKYPRDCELCPLAVFHQYNLTHTAMVGGRSTDSLLWQETYWLSMLGVKQTMIVAGIVTTVFQRHSCQAASTSKANSAGVLSQEILRAGQWSQESTFFNFYCKQILTDTLCNEHI